MHDNTLTDDNREKFIQIANHYGQLLKFYNVEELCADKIAKIRELFSAVYKTHFSIATFYRFFISSILPTEIEKIIYLDSDIIVNLDINELWKIDMKNNPLAAIPEVDNNVPISKHSKLCHDGVVKSEDYFNAGVMVMNFEVLRNEEENISSGMKFIGTNHYNYFDQDVFNYCFETRTLKLPVKFNRMVKQMRIDGNFSVKGEIYHYAGGKLGLGLDIGDPFNRLWWSYFIKTPWFGVDTIDKILKGTQDSILISVPDNKERVFVVDEEHSCQIEKNFSVRYEEKVIIVDPKNKDDLKQLTGLIESGRGNKVFLIGIPNIVSTLDKIGFCEGIDFFNIFAFYSPAWANLTSNRSLILSI